MRCDRVCILRAEAGHVYIVKGGFEGEESCADICNVRDGDVEWTTLLCRVRRAKCKNQETRGELYRWVILLQIKVNSCKEFFSGMRGAYGTYVPTCLCICRSESFHHVIQ